MNYKKQIRLKASSMKELSKASKINGSLKLNNLKCICGKPWGIGFSICAACGMVKYNIFRHLVLKSVIVFGNKKDTVPCIIYSDNSIIKNMI